MKFGAQNALRKSPLSGLRILVGRARHQASALSRGLEALGADVIEIPFIEIRKPRSYKPLDAALKQIENYDWLVLTSVNGVDAIADRMKKLGMNLSALQHLQIAAIGPATRAEVENLGLKVSVVPERYVAESVVKNLRSKVGDKRVLLARAQVARDVIPRELRKTGANVDVVEAYETVVPTSSGKRLLALMGDEKQRPHVVCFTSSSTVRNFAELVGSTRSRATRTASRAHSVGTIANSPVLQRRVPPGEQSTPMETADILDGIKFASIGPITSSTLRELDLPVQIEASEYTIPGLIRAIVKARP